jgi:hypothetical protein
MILLGKLKAAPEEIVVVRFVVAASMIFVPKCEAAMEGVIFVVRFRAVMVIFVERFVAAASVIFVPKGEAVTEGVIFVVKFRVASVIFMATSEVGSEVRFVVRFGVASVKFVVRSVVAVVGREAVWLVSRWRLALMSVERLVCRCERKACVLLGEVVELVGVVATLVVTTVAAPALAWAVGGAPLTAVLLDLAPPPLHEDSPFILGVLARKKLVGALSVSEVFLPLVLSPALAFSVSESWLGLRTSRDVTLGDVAMSRDVTVGDLGWMLNLAGATEPEATVACVVAAVFLVVIGYKLKYKLLATTSNSM